MSVLLSVHKISKSFGAKTLFQDLTFSIETSQKIGLLGPNGAGKSTLMQILAGLQKPDAGKVSFSTGLKIGYLTQTPVLPGDEDIYNTILNATDDPYDYENMQLTQELISRLSLDSMAAGSETPVGQLSGGWKKRVALARELVKRPNLLILDEPTNHLDVHSILWLEDFLASQGSLAVLTVTHDRLFLQKTCDVIFDLDPRNPDGLIKSTGSYADYVLLKEQLLDAQKRLEDVKRNTFRRETEWLRRGAAGRHTKQTARIERGHELGQELSDLSDKNRHRRVDMEFADVARAPKKMIEATGITKSFGDRVLFQDFSCLISPQARFGILGENGCGKSTFLKILIGEQKPDSGTVFVNEDIEISYFEQQKDSLDPNISVIKTICPEGDYVHFQGSPVFAKSYLSRFLFHTNQMDLPVGKLSGGEQSRLLIARLMLQNSQILILDEPTNDLDMETLNVLQDCLINFRGAVILVSHDRFFMDQVVDTLYAFTDTEGEILKFSGYFQWEQWFQENKRSKSGKNSAAKNSQSKKIEATSPASIEKKKLSQKEQKELDGMEALIQKEEALLATLHGEISAASDYKKITEVTQKAAEQQAKVDSLYARWEDLLGKLK